MNLARRLFRRSLSEGDSNEVGGLKQLERFKESFSSCDLGQHNIQSSLLKNEDEDFRKDFYIQKNTKTLKTAKRQSDDISISDAPVLDRKELIEEKDDLFNESFQNSENQTRKNQLNYDELVHVDNKHPAGDSGYSSTETNELSEFDFNLLQNEKELDEKDDTRITLNTFSAEDRNCTLSQQVGEANKRICGKMKRQCRRKHSRKKYSIRRSKRNRKKKKDEPSMILKSDIISITEENSDKIRKEIERAVLKLNFLWRNDSKITFQYVWSLLACKGNNFALKTLEDPTCQNNIWFRGLLEIHVCPILELPGLDFKKEWHRLCSFGTSINHLHLHNVSYIRLAETGFFFAPNERKEPCVKCFACSITWHVSTLEAKSNCNENLRILHKKGCSLSRSGNEPIHLVPHRGFPLPDTLPSKNKIPFRNGNGHWTKCVDLCGLNAFYTEQMKLLQTFPILIEKYEKYMQSNNPFQAILHMFEESVRHRNSAKGMVELLMHVKKTDLSNETKICLSNFELISFICQLMKDKISLERKCHCGTKINLKEQIIVFPCKCKCDRRIPGYFQHCINQSLQDILLTQTCEICLSRIQWKLLGPPPCLFISLTFLNIEDTSEIPQIVHIIGRKYQRWGVYLHGGNHFTCQLPNPDGGSNIYDDHNVVPDDCYSAYLVPQEDCLCLSRKPCMVSFCIMED